MLIIVIGLGREREKEDGVFPCRTTMRYDSSPVVLMHVRTVWNRGHCHQSCISMTTTFDWHLRLIADDQPRSPSIATLVLVGPNQIFARYIYWGGSFVRASLARRYSSDMWYSTLIQVDMCDLSVIRFFLESGYCALALMLGSQLVVGLHTLAQSTVGLHT